MTPLELLQAIARQAALVRKLQRAYFRTRGKGALLDAKNAEATLDTLLEGVFPPEPAAPPAQGRLL